MSFRTCENNVSYIYYIYIDLYRPMHVTDVIKSCVTFINVLMVLYEDPPLVTSTSLTYLNKVVYMKGARFGTL